MIFSKRLKLSNKVAEWFDKADKNLSPTKIKRNSLGTITALDALGYLKERKSESNFCRCGQVKHIGFNECIDCIEERESKG